MPVTNRSCYHNTIVCAVCGGVGTHLFLSMCRCCAVVLRVKSSFRCSLCHAHLLCLVSCTHGKGTTCRHHGVCDRITGAFR